MIVDLNRARPIHFALIDGIRRFAMDVRELDIDLIDSINPFKEAYAIMAKTMSEDSLKQVAAAIAAKRTSLTPEEAKKPKEDFFAGNDKCRYDHFRMGDGKIDACEVAGNSIIQAVLSPDVQVYQNGEYKPLSRPIFMYPSAKSMKKYGLRESSKSGLSTGVLKGDKGQIKGFVEFVRGPGAGLTNPAMLAGAAAVVAGEAARKGHREDQQRELGVAAGIHVLILLAGRPRRMRRVVGEPQQIRRVAGGAAQPWLNLPDEYIVANNPVVRGCTRGQVAHGDASYEARIVATDRRSDLAALEPIGGGVAMRFIELRPGPRPDDEGWHRTATIDIDIVEVTLDLQNTPVAAPFTG